MRGGGTCPNPTKLKKVTWCPTLFWRLPFKPALGHQKCFMFSDQQMWQCNALWVKMNKLQTGIRKCLKNFLRAKKCDLSLIEIIQYIFSWNAMFSCRLYNAYDNMYSVYIVICSKGIFRTLKGNHDFFRTNLTLLSLIQVGGGSFRKI